MATAFSNSWKKSTKTEKQRKYVYNAPYHVRGRLMSSPLSKDLRKKYGIRNVRVRKGDKVTVLRGQFKGKSGKIESVDMGKYKVFIEKIETVKKDGTKAGYPIHPSNVIITEPNTEDKQRFKRATQKPVKSDDTEKPTNQGGKND